MYTFTYTYLKKLLSIAYKLIPLDTGALGTTGTVISPVVGSDDEVTKGGIGSEAGVDVCRVLESPVVILVSIFTPELELPEVLVLVLAAGAAGGAIILITTCPFDANFKLPRALVAFALLFVLANLGFN